MSAGHELAFALALAAGTGMQAGRWALTELHAQIRRRDAADTRAERMRWQREGMPRYDGVAWMLLFVGTAAQAVGLVLERL